MIKESEVIILLNASTIKYWLAKGYSVPTHIDSKGRVKTFKQGVTRLLVKVVDLPSKSNVLITAVCGDCSVERQLPYCNYAPVCWACNLQKQKGMQHPRWLHKSKSVGPDRAFDLYLQRRYGITAETYFKVFEQQDYRCAICKTPQAIEGRKFAVDHNHDTEEFRGILCQPCNTAIGLLKENPDTINAVLLYLNKKAVHV